MIQRSNETGAERAKSVNVPMLVVLLLIFLGTIGTSYSVSTTMEQRSQARFENLVAENEQSLLHRLDTYEHALLGGVGYFNSSENISRSEWRAYVDTLDIGDRLPGINGVGYIANVAEVDLNSFVSEALSNGFIEFAIKPETDRPETYVVKFVEPESLNLAAIGLNIAFEAIRKSAADHAMDTGSSSITDTILLVQDSQQTPGFLLLTPVYENHMAPDTVEERRAAHMGWVYAPFIAKNFLSEMTLSQGDTLDISVYDGAEISGNLLIYGSGGLDQAAATSSQFITTKTIRVFQQDWTLVWNSTAAFETAQVNNEPTIILVVGLMLTGLLALFLAREFRRSASIREQVRIKTREIDEANI